MTLGKVAFEEFFGIVPPLMKRGRERLGISQLKMAEMLGYAAYRNVTSLSAVETGQRDIAVSVLFKMCELLGPDFVDDVADEMFKVAMNGLAHKRNELLDEAGRVTTVIRDRKRKPRPA